MRWTIRTKLTVLILFSILIPLGFLGSHIYRVTTRSLQERIGQSMRVQATTMINQIDNVLYERYQNVQSWSEEEMMLGVLNEDEEGRIKDFLTTLKKQYSFYADIICTDNAGKIIASSNPSLVGKSARDEMWFRHVQTKGQVLAEVQPSSQFMQSYGAFFAAPIPTDKILKQVRPNVAADPEKEKMLTAIDLWQPKSLGVVAAWVNWSEIINLINSMPVLDGQTHSRDAYILLMGKEGLTLTQPLFEDRPILFRENLIKSGITAAEKAAAGTNGYTVETGRYGGIDFIGYASSKGSQSFKGFGWSVLIFQNASQALAPIKRLRLQILAVTFAVALAAVLLTILLAQGISRPIEKLAEFAKVIGRGDFSGSFPVKSRDEVGMLAVSFNEMIGNLKNARNDLLSARDFTENIIKSIGDALLVITPQGRIRSFNPAALKLLGYDEKELTDFPAARLFSKDFQSNAKKMAFLNGGELSTEEAEFIDKNGTPIPILFSATTLHNPSGKNQGVVLIARDMRDYKSLQNQFLEAQKMDAIGRLAGGVAHDFNNMLTVINGYSEDILINRGSVEAIPRKVGEVLKAGRRASRLVAQLLSFSRRQSSKPEILDVNRLVQGMDKMLKLITGVRIEIVVLLAHDLVPVKLDSSLFEQVLTNLVVNARDAMPNGGKLYIETRNAKIDPALLTSHPEAEPGSYALIEVRDTGTGMTEEIKKRIFEPFFTTKPKGKGTGLGLATCFDFMKTSSGFIEVKTELGKGTAFQLYFPKADGTPQNLSDQEISQEIPKGSETILLVDDEDLVREFYDRALTGLGYKVFQASGGNDALKLFRETLHGKVDVLLTDVVMPGMDGPHLAEAIRKSSSNIKIIFMSGYVEDDTFFDSLENTGMAFLQKPAMLSALALKIREVMGIK